MTFAFTSSSIPFDVFRAFFLTTEKSILDSDHLRSTPDTTSDDDTGDDDGDVIAPTRTALYARPSDAATFKRRHARRHAINPTPSYYPHGPDSGHFSTVTILGLDSAGVSQPVSITCNRMRRSCLKQQL